MTDWFWFKLLVGADLLPSTGFKMNFLDKWSAGRISKFIMRSLFFVIRIFFQFVNSICLMLALIELVYDPMDDFPSINGCSYCWFFYLSVFNISKVFFYPSFQVSSCLSYIYLLKILATDLINCNNCSWFDKWLISFLVECDLSSRKAKYSLCSIWSEA